MNILSLNPVLDLELRQRSRTLRSVLVLVGFLLLLLGVLYLAYEAQAVSSSFAFDPMSSVVVNAGRSMFEWVVATELAIIMVIIPVISAGSIAGERARQTLIPLQVTMISPTKIFLGKVLASSAFILLLLVASAPVLAVTYLVGGIGLAQILLTLGYLLCVGFLLTAIGVASSCFCRRTQTATIAAIALVIAMTVGPLAAGGITFIVDSRSGNDANTVPPEVFLLNPWTGVVDVAGDEFSSAPGPFSVIKRQLINAEREGEVIFNADGTMQAWDGGDVEQESSYPLWVGSLGAQLVVAGLLSVIGIRKLRTPGPELAA